MCGQMRPSFAVSPAPILRDGLQPAGLDQDLQRLVELLRILRPGEPGLAPQLPGIDDVVRLGFQQPAPDGHGVALRLRHG